MTGKLNFLYGTMGSAKTAELLIEAYNHEANGLKVMTIKPRTDRDPKLITSRIKGLSREADFVITAEDNIYDLIPEDVDSLFVDEVQFFTPEQINQLSNLAKDKKIDVFAYGLRSDFKMDGFPGSSRLLQVAYEVREKYYRCRIEKCHNKAVVNARFNNYDLQTEGEQVVIDDGKTATRYFALCFDCYFKIAEGDLEKIEEAKTLIDKAILKEKEDKAKEAAMEEMKKYLEDLGILTNETIINELEKIASNAVQTSLNEKGPVRIRKKDYQ